MNFFFPANFGFFININEIIKQWGPYWRALAVTRIYEKANTAILDYQTLLYIHFSLSSFTEMTYGIQAIC